MRNARLFIVLCSLLLNCLFAYNRKTSCPTLMVNGVKIVPVDFRRFVRDPTLPVLSKTYFLYAHQSLSFFEQQLATIDLANINSAKLIEITQSMHVIAGKGLTAEGPRYGGTLNKGGRLGVFREDAENTRLRTIMPPALLYFKEAAASLHLDLSLKDGSVPIAKLPDVALPYNIGPEHYYPPSSFVPLYFEHAASLLRSLSKTKQNSNEALSLISEYFHTLCNARAFESINNSLNFNQTNALLQKFGFHAISHGYSDHIARRTSAKDFEAFFKAQVSGELPLPSKEVQAYFEE